MSVVIERDVYPKTSKLVALYEACGLAALAQDEGALTRAVVNSMAVVTAWTGEEHLVGLARAVGDGEQILVIAQLLVRPDLPFAEVAAALTDQLLAMYPTLPVRFALPSDAPSAAVFDARSIPHPPTP